jgi:hypothetical protein
MSNVQDAAAAAAITATSTSSTSNAESKDHGSESDAAPPKLVRQLSQRSLTLLQAAFKKLENKGNL